MHVTGGQYKGYKLIVPDCSKPTLSKTREGVFNVLFSYFGDFSNLTFLDLFSGSGLMALEAASRGFHSFAVDINQSAINIIKKNVKIAKDKITVIKADACKFVQKTDLAPDVIYIDPPWDYDYSKILGAVFQKFNNTIVVVESDKKAAQAIGKIYADFLVPFKEKVYGRSKTDFIEIP